MKRNVLLLLAVVVSAVLVVNSTKRIMTFRSNSQKVEEEEAKLERLKHENETLKKELEYKKSQGFAEGEIRDKLGLAKEGETVVVLPKNEASRSIMDDSQKNTKPNWQKWRDLIFGT